MLKDEIVKYKNKINVIKSVEINIKGDEIEE